MLNLLGRVFLLALGQKIMADHMPECQKRRISCLVVLGIAALVFFVQGMAALLFGVYLSLSALYGLPSYCAAFSVAGIADFH